MLIRCFAHDFLFDEAFQDPFCDETWFLVFFGFVDEFVGDVTVRQHFVYGHYTPFWERIFRECVDSLDEMACIVLVKNILHFLVGDFVDLIEFFN